MQDSVWSGFAIDGRRCHLVVRVIEQLCPYSDTDETPKKENNENLSQVYTYKK